MQVWLTICIAIERYLSMTRYQWAKSKFTQRRVSAFIWGTSGLCVLLNSPFWFLFSLQPELKPSKPEPALLLMPNSTGRSTCDQATVTASDGGWTTAMEGTSSRGPPVHVDAAANAFSGSAEQRSRNASASDNISASAPAATAASSGLSPKLQQTGDFLRCQSAFYRSEAYGSYSYARLVFVQFGPLLLLVFFNCLLIVITFLHRKRRRRINSRDARQMAVYSGIDYSTVYFVFLV